MMKSMAGNRSQALTRAGGGAALVSLLLASPLPRFCVPSVLLAGVNGENSAGSAVPHHTYTTRFAKTENPISEGGQWRNGAKDAVDWTDVRTANGLAFGTELGGKRTSPQEYDDSTALLTGTWAPDQTAQATVHFVNSNARINEEVELRLRSNLSPHKATGYEILFRAFNGANSYCEIVRWNGPLGDFTYLGRAKGTRCALHDGGVVKATAIGNVITAYIDGVQVVQARDDTYSNGNPGIGFFLYGATGVGADFGFTSFTASDH